MDLKEYIRAVPDFPKPGIVFRDVSPLLASPEAFAHATDLFAEMWQDKVDVVAGIDARGFIFGTALALRLRLPFVMLRKKSKLPGVTESVSYGLEYGKDTLEVQVGALAHGTRVLVVDDLLATGGTAVAASTLLQRVGGCVAGYAFVVELGDFRDKRELGDYPIQTLLSY